MRLQRHDQRREEMVDQLVILINAYAELKETLENVPTGHYPVI